MARIAKRAAWGLWLATFPLTAGCDVTGAQMQDFATSTAIRLVVQSVASILESLVITGVGSG